MKHLKKYEEISSDEDKYIIGYGLGGGFGGIQNYEVIEAYDLEDAEKRSYQKACEEFEEYDGMYGLRSLDDIKEEDDIEDNDEAEEIWREERESWLEYISFPYSDEKAEELKVYHFNNPYEEEE